MTKAESSKAAASNGIRANDAGAGTVYELPWYARAPGHAQHQR